MRKNKLLLLLALLLTAATGAWAEEQVVYTLDGTQTASNNNYATAGVVNQGSITWMVTGNTSMNPWRIGGKSLSGVDRPIWSENSLDETVTKVTLEFGTASSITVNSITMTVAGDDGFSDVIDTKAVTFSANNTVDVTPTEGKEWKNAYYRFVFNVTVSGSSNKFLQLKSIKFYNDPDAQQQGGGGTEPVAGTFTVSLKEGTKDAKNWSIASGEKSAKGDAADGLTGLSEGDQVTLTYNGRLKVKGVKATSEAAPTGNSVDLSTLTADYEAQDGETLTGTLAGNYKISIADGATVTLDGVTINGVNDLNYEWAGITCLGDATIILSGTNTVKGFDEDYPGIQAAADKTLIINGTGSLTASSYGYAAAIGGKSGVACGNIEIQGGTITATSGDRGAGIGGGYNAGWGDITISGGTVNATGGEHGAGIGGGRRATASFSCGNITISGGTITATGGADAAGIGGGRGNNNNYKSSCGTITITSGVTKVTATKGDGATNSIGAGKYCNCGTVTIGGVVGAISTSPYTYEPGK